MKPDKKPPIKTDAIDEAAQQLLEWIATLDPNWKRSIEIAITEHGWSARQALGAFVGYVLDNNLHMVVPRRAEFETGWKGVAGTNYCDFCLQPFAVKYAGQHFCSNECARGEKPVIEVPPPVTEPDEFAEV